MSKGYQWLKVDILVKIFLIARGWHVVKRKSASLANRKHSVSLVSKSTPGCEQHHLRVLGSGTGGQWTHFYFHTRVLFVIAHNTLQLLTPGKDSSISRAQLGSEAITLIVLWLYSVIALITSATVRTTVLNLRLRVLYGTSHYFSFLINIVRLPYLSLGTYMWFFLCLVSSYPLLGYTSSLENVRFSSYYVSIRRFPQAYLLTSLALLVLFYLWG